VQQKRQRRLKTDTPREKKDAKYYEKRKRNNMAAKKSREAKRRRDNEVSVLGDFYFTFQLFLHTYNGLLIFNNITTVRSTNKFKIFTGLILLFPIFFVFVFQFYQFRKVYSI